MFQRALSLVALVVTISAVSLPAVAQPRFEILDLNDLNDTLAAIPVSISNQGVIVGYSDLAGGDWLVATKWIDGRAMSLGLVPGDDTSDAAAVNDLGAAVGTSSWIEEIGHILIIHPTAVLYEGEDVIEIESLVTSGEHWELLAASDINSSGQILGSGRDLDTETPVAWVFTDGVMTELGTLGGYATSPVAMNDAGIVVGQSWTSGGQDHAFVWDDGVMTDLGTLGGRDSRATGVTEDGFIVGWAQSPSNPTLAVYWEDGVMTVMGTLGGNQSSAAAVNERRQIVGFSTDENHHAHMFFWEDGVMWNPMEHLVSPDDWGGRASAYDMNDAGQFIGTAYRSSSGDAPAVLTPVELEMSDLEPGVAGEVNTLTLSGLTPGARSHIVFGKSAGMTRIPGCPGAPVLISNPRLGGSIVADPDGTATLMKTVPPHLAGRSFRIQALERSDCKVSNVVSVTLM